MLKVWTKFSFMTKLQLPKLHKTVVKTFLIINISNSNKLNKFWVGIFTSHTSHQSSLLNGSEWVSQWVSDKHCQWSDSGPIKIFVPIKYILNIYWIWVFSLYVIVVLLVIKHMIYLSENELNTQPLTFVQCQIHNYSFWVSWGFSSQPDITFM